MAHTHTQKTLHLVESAILFALVLILQIWGSSIHIGATSFSLVLIPIIVGGIVVGPLCGAFLGLTFGIITYCAGLFGADPFTAMLIQTHPFYTALLCLLKATLAGLVPALLYRTVKKRDEVAASFVAALSAPVINTGVFISVALLFVGDSIEKAGMTDVYLNGETLIYFLVIGCAGINFIVEFFVNLLFAPALSYLVKAINRRRG